MREKLGNAAGLSLVEATVILATISILTAALAPVAKRTTDIARITRATSDLSAIRQAILDFTAAKPNQLKFTVDGAVNGARVDLLVSDGDIPREVSGTGSAAWQRVVDNTTGKVDFLERHLVTNNPRGNVANAYAIPPNFNSPGWRGAFLSAPVDPDPWGNRYMVNTKFMVSSDDNPPWYDVFVYSAGPDEIIDTLFALDGAVPGNDDMILIVFRHPLAGKTGVGVDGSDDTGNF